MAITVHTTGVVAACNGIVDLVEAGGRGYVELHNAAHGAGVVFVLSASAFSSAQVSASSANATASVPFSATCNTASIAIEHFHVFSTASVTIWTGVCTTAAGGDLVFSNLSAVTGDTLVITAWNFIVGATEV
jgi:hypothetical protein